MGSSAGTGASSTMWPSAPTARGWPPRPGTARRGSGTPPPVVKPPCCGTNARHSEAQIVSSVAWHPGGTQLATVTRGDAITLWDLAAGKPRQVFTAPTGGLDRGCPSGLQPGGHAAGLGESRRHGAALGRGHGGAGRYLAGARGACPGRGLQPRREHGSPASDSTGRCGSGT